MFLSFIFGLGIGYILTTIKDFKTILSLILQKIYIPNSLIQISKNQYRLDYTFHGSVYSLLLNIRRGPHSIIRIIDKGHFNVTDKVRPYLGPSENTHRIVYPLTPKRIGYDFLEISTIQGKTYRFNGDDEIIID